MKASELRSKSTAELTNELHELLRQQFNLNMQSGFSETTKSHLFKQVRRNIARIKTILNEQQEK